MILLCVLAGAAAGLVHDHHHLIGDAETEANLFLEVSSARGKLSRSTDGPEGILIISQ